ncbi:hypothetical protein STEG23_010929 [Scotinomys teguina]
MSRMCRPPWFLDPGGWSKSAAVGLYFIFPGICTLSLERGVSFRFLTDSFPQEYVTTSRKFSTPTTMASANSFK